MKGTRLYLDAHRSPDNRIEAMFRIQESKVGNRGPKPMATRRDLALQATDDATTPKAQDSMIPRALGDIACLTSKKDLGP